MKRNKAPRNISILTKINGAGEDWSMTGASWPEVDIDMIDSSELRYF